MLVRSREPRAPDVAVVLGSGLGSFTDTLVAANTFPYSEIPHMPRVSIPGHVGKLVIGELPNTPPGVRSPLVAALAGRIHLYEGYEPEDVVFPVRLLIALGARVVVLTNAAGGVSAAFRPGDLVAISDHISFQARHPLVGPNDDRLGPRFPDMTEVYDRDLRRLAHETAKAAGMILHEGVYVAFQGPSYETPAEIRMVRVIGGDLVGMSTVPEAIAARHMGARVLGISCVTNLAAGISPVPLSHTEVEITAREARGRFASLLEGTIRAISA